MNEQFLLLLLLLRLPLPLRLPLRLPLPLLLCLCLLVRLILLLSLLLLLPWLALLASSRRGGSSGASVTQLGLPRLVASECRERVLDHHRRNACLLRIEPLPS